MKSTIASLLLLVISVPIANATGMYKCDAADRTKWQPEESLRAKLEEEGWEIRKIKEDGNCYEVYATSPEGQRGEAYFHPETLELELLARRGKVLFKKTD